MDKKQHSKEKKTQEEKKGQTACDSLSAEGSRYTDTSNNDNTYGLRLSLHMRKVYKGR